MKGGQVVMTVGVKGAVGPVRSAILSACGRYRYKLSRGWGEGPRVLWVMLNPSTADADHDDPTIRKCVGFSRRWGFAGLDVVNLFALRSTNPRALRTATDPVGPLNEEALILAAAGADSIVCAWGAHVTACGRFIRRAERVLAMLRGPDPQPLGANARPIFHLGLTSLGQPAHPLMLAYSTPLTRWSPK